MDVYSQLAKRQLEILREEGLAITVGYHLNTPEEMNFAMEEVKQNFINSGMTLETVSNALLEYNTPEGRETFISMIRSANQEPEMTQQEMKDAIEQLCMQNGQDIPVFADDEELSVKIVMGDPDENGVQAPILTFFSKKIEE